MSDDRIEIISFEHAVTPDAPEQPPSEPPGRGRLLIAAVLAGVGAALLAMVVLIADDPEEAETPVTTTTTTTTVPPAFSEAVYRAITPSLVLIETDHPASPSADDPAAQAENGPDDGRGLGTGVVINAEGLVMTSHHVIEGASAIRLHFADGTVTDGEIADADPSVDIAILLPTEPPGFIVPAVLGGGVTIGQEAYAVGHPLGLSGSLSAGVISGLDRSVPIDDERILDGLIQFDAAVNPGNSGGPLLDRNGVVVGIVTALANVTEDASFSGIGFAVPIETAGGGLAPGQ